MTLPIPQPIAIDDPDKLVTIGKYIESVDAHMAKGLLESAGIESFLQGENANNLLGAAFRARLLVHKQDEDTAREILGAESDSAEPEDDAS